MTFDYMNDREKQERERRQVAANAEERRLNKYPQIPFPDVDGGGRGVSGLGILVGAAIVWFVLSGILAPKPNSSILTFKGPDIAQYIATETRRQGFIGLTPVCPVDLPATIGATTHCQVPGPNGYGITVTAADSNGSVGISYQADAELVSGLAIAQEMPARLPEREKYPNATATCPDDLLANGGEIRCQLTSGSDTYGVAVTNHYTNDGLSDLSFQVDDQPS